MGGHGLPTGPFRQGTYFFQGDGHYTSETNYQRTNSAATLFVREIGTFRLAGNQLRIYLTDVQWKFSGTDPNIPELQAQFDQQKAQWIEKTNLEPPSEVAFADNDSITILPSKGNASAYHRVG